ncbi:glutathione S-transferase [Oscillatoriales cyanobacterium USR001]|nr:glutathione S-transferase [Oscillatoriales cyanobacterium USR001]
MRARLALIVSDRACELREVVLRDKPQEMLQVSPKGTVPILIDIDGRILDESIDIMLWALTQYDPEKWLVPETGSIAEMLELIAQFDNGFKYHLDRYKYPDRYPEIDTEIHRTEGSLYLDKLNEKLRTKKYLFGNRVALADMAIAPFIRQFAHTDRDWFNSQSWPYLQTWLSWFIDSEIYNRVMKKYPKWESGNPTVQL